MSIIIRIDVDRPYGKRSVSRQVLSRCSSDFYLPGIESWGYLEDLRKILLILNQYHVGACIFFRKCTLPTQSVLKIIDEGKHLKGLHLENSRSYSNFISELKNLENFLNEPVLAFSKHGCGIKKYGFHHFAPYEPEAYINWGNKAGLKYFFGNGTDPTDNMNKFKNLTVYPGAFWLEPFWRDTETFSIEWLLKAASKRNIVLLFHPDNILVDEKLFKALIKVIQTVRIEVLN